MLFLNEMTQDIEAMLRSDIEAMLRSDIEAMLRSDIEAMLRSDIEVMLHEELIRQHGIKYTIVLTAELEKLRLSVDQVYDDNSKPDVITSTAYFRSDATPVQNKDDSNIQVAIDQLLGHLKEFCHEGSGWRLKRVIAIDLGIARYQPFRVRSYFKTPDYIPLCSIVNVKNDDNKCFMWTLPKRTISTPKQECRSNCRVSKPYR